MINGNLRIFCQSCAKLRLITFAFTSEMLLQHQEEDIKWILKGRAHYN